MRPRSHGIKSTVIQRTGHPRLWMHIAPQTGPPQVCHRVHATVEIWREVFKASDPPPHAVPPQWAALLGVRRSILHRQRSAIDAAALGRLNDLPDVATSNLDFPRAFTAELRTAALAGLLGLLPHQN